MACHNKIDSPEWAPKISLAGLMLAEQFAKNGSPGPCTFAATISLAKPILAAITGLPCQF